MPNHLLAEWKEEAGSKPSDADSYLYAGPSGLWPPVSKLVAPPQPKPRNAMRYFKVLFLASESRVEFHSSRVLEPYCPEDTWVLREVLVSHPELSQKLGVTGHGKGAQTKLRHRTESLHPDPLALGLLPGRRWAETRSQRCSPTPRQSETTLQGPQEGKTKGKVTSRL